MRGEQMDGCNVHGQLPVRWDDWLRGIMDDGLGSTRRAKASKGVASYSHLER